MFTCIACTKQTEEAGEGEDAAARGGGGGGGVDTPASKEAVKSLTTQIKDMALKISGTYRQCKPCTGSSTYKGGQRPYPDFDTISEGVPHPFGIASSSSTPAWYFTGGGTHGCPNRADPRFGVELSGDRTPRGVSFSGQSCDMVMEDDDVPKEWMAQVEPGVHITFVSLPHGGNDLKRIRFSRNIFDKWHAQRWWAENYDRIMELYNVQRFNRQALQTPSGSEDGRDSNYTRVAESPVVPLASREWTPSSHYGPTGGPYSGSSTGYGPATGYKQSDAASMDASRMTTDSRDEASASASHSNASEVETEWVEQDEPGVHITIRQLVDGTRELRRVRFSRERFGEVRAKMWWEENRERIQTQYL
ncbi:hypothetical protein SAY87_012754 [Trapa incisa]|uniref:BRX domain-containing protein n=1 Tax=Trapa incisa TaxID=236973 RepID=A0AAN7H1H5_9MYRT|nr:hypothetical protein SAY87_012754 [Trapa incisa]